MDSGQHRAVWLPAGAWHEHRFYGASSFHSIGFPADQPPLLPTYEPTVVAVDPLLRELLVVVSDAHIGAPEARRIRAVLKDRMRHAAVQPIALPTPADPRLADACRLVEASLEQPRSLPWLANRVHTSERTLSRLFRIEFAMTYPQWRNRLRVLTAMVMLAEGASVTETAQRCGFSTTSAFVDTFHRSTGTTPGPHRQKQPANRAHPS